MSTPGPPEQEAQGVTPPYRKEEPPIQENPISRSSADSPSGGPGRIESDEERDGVGDTDLEPEPALGVGEHLTTAGESRAGQDAGEEGRKGTSGRPYGEQPDESGVSEQHDETDSPVAGQPGDQGG